MNLYFQETFSLALPGVVAKPVTHYVILYADRRDRPSVPSAAIAIFAHRHDRRTKSPISGISDIGD